jgi:diguanylate cyclase (GGDEF)-like protein/PAS domain S-box-containing protein
MNESVYPLLENLFEASYVVDKDRRIIEWSKQSERITGYKKEDVVGKYCYDNILKHVTKSGKQLCMSDCPLHHTLKTGHINFAEVFLHHKQGHRVPVKVRSIPVYNDKDEIVASIEIFTDERTNKELYNENRSLKKNLTTDALTQIHNRGYLDYYLKMIDEEATLFGTKFALLFIDIDHFKAVNDTYGHSNGDKVLQMVAKTISMSCRKEDVIGRYGGEEFLVVLKDVDQNTLKTIAEKFRVIVEKSTVFIDDTNTIEVTISIGGVCYDSSISIEENIKLADQKMYQAKAKGRNQVII